MTAKTAELGSVSSGTLASGDLVERFREVLEELDPDTAHELDKLYKGWDSGTEDAEVLIEIYVDELQDCLADLAPEGAYFGTHPGDGADFGFWQSEY